MWARIPRVKFTDGFSCPVIGLGTNQAHGAEGVNSIKQAINIGYRHIDTAYSYGSEREVGQAIKEKMNEGYVAREHLFITTKLWSSFHAPQHVAPAFERSMKNLGLEYVDLYLMHMPMGLAFRGYEEQDLIAYTGKVLCSDVDFCDTWKAMEELVMSGRVHSIGVSNFNCTQLERLLSSASIKPVINQVECNPDFNQKPLIQFCRNLGIAVSAYSTFGRIGLIDSSDSSYQWTAKVLLHPEVTAIAASYEKTPAQIVLRYLMDIGTVPLPRPVNRTEMIQDIDIFDFMLTPDEVAMIDQLNKGKRAEPLAQYNHHRDYPFERDEV